MRSLRLDVLAIAAGAASCAPIAVSHRPALRGEEHAGRSLTQFVDPLICTSNEGNTYPGAVRPFGMLSWSPTSTAGDQTSTAAANGYSYDTTRVRGFALTHVNGAGCLPGAMGDVPITPHTGAMTISPSADTKDAIYASDFSHADESCAGPLYPEARQRREERFCRDDPRGRRHVRVPGW